MVNFGRPHLRTLTAVAFLILASRTPPGFAQSGTRPVELTAEATPRGTETLTYDHVHLGVPDPAKGVGWYLKYMGAQPGPAGEPGDRVLFGKTRFIFKETQSPLPSDGSAVDSVGFSFADIDSKMREFEAAGIKIVAPVHEVEGLYKAGVIEDPWGTKIQVVQDPETLGFHHVQLRVPEPEAAFKWYLEMFGGERTKLKGKIDALRYGDVWILVRQGVAAPSEGHAIDHIGWRTTDIFKKEAELKAKGVRFTTEPHAVRNNHVSYIAGFGGVKIELNQRGGDAPTPPASH